MLIGSDYRPGYFSQGVSERTDVMIVMSIDPRTRRMAAVTFPRDLANVPLGKGVVYPLRINELYARWKAELGGRRKALRRLERVFESILATEIDYHALIRFRGFGRLIDSVGGIDVRLDRRQYPQGIVDPSYQDASDSRGIHFPPGRNHLDGHDVCRGTVAVCHDALVFVRSRKGPNNNDFQRARRQVAVVLAAIRRVREIGPERIPGLLAAMRQVAEEKDFLTNVPFEAAPAFYELFAGAKLGNRIRVLGPPFAYPVGRQYWYALDLGRVRELADRYFPPVP